MGKRFGEKSRAKRTGLPESERQNPNPLTAADITTID